MKRCHKQWKENNHMWKELDMNRINDMYTIEFKSMSEIAVEMDTTVNTIKSRLKLMNIKQRGMSKLVRVAKTRHPKGSLNGKDNPAYIHGKMVGLNVNRKQYLEIAKKHFTWICHTCEKNDTKNDLGVHHINGNNKDNRPINLLVLCQSCHAKQHNNNGVFTSGGVHS